MDNFDISESNKLNQAEIAQKNKVEVKIEKFRYFEKIWNRVTMFLLGLALIFFAIGYISLKALIVIPQLIQDFAEAFFYVYLGYFAFMIARILKFFFVIRPLGEKVKIGKSIRAVILSPVGIVILYLGMLMMALTSCS